MTDQPTPRQDGHGSDDTPAGYQPPQFVPPQGSDNPAPPPFDQPQAGAQQQFDPPGDPGLTPPPLYSQPGQQQYGQPAEPYGNPYAQPGSPYGQPAGPYGQPVNPYGQPAYYGMPVEPKGLSIAAMVCGIIGVVTGGFFVIPQIAAVILGHIGLKKEPAGRGFALTGLITGYLGVLFGAFWLFFLVLSAIFASQSGYNY